MPPEEDNQRAASQERPPSQPPPIPPTVQRRDLPEAFWKVFLEKMAISLRILAKELNQKKIKVARFATRKLSPLAFLFRFPRKLQPLIFN